MKKGSARNKAVFKECLRIFALPFLIFFIYSILMFVVFWLYRITLEPFIYVALLAFFFLIIFFVIRLVKEFKTAEVRQRLMNNILCEWKAMAEGQNLREKDYHKMIEVLGARLEQITGEYEEARKETQDFYTAWVHQIKTPIAVMKLALDKTNNIGTGTAALQEELFRIEQYTDMVLAFQRIGSSSTDLLIQEYSLDEIIREVIRKFAPQFIYKKLRLEYEGCEATIVIDKKWFTCIVEQLLSNAIKYTNEGSVSISLENKILLVKDTGIGIAPEDLPRIFEKGYTGSNGRLGEKSSGLGLYLCSKAAKLLNLTVKAQANVGQGSVFSIDLHEKIIFGK